MTLRDGTNLSRWEGGLFDRDNADSVSLLFRLIWLFTAYRAAGGRIGLNEAGRPLGVPGDTDVGRAGAGSGGTLSGLSTVFYQWGRYLLYRATGGRQGTPSAADPYGTPSRHLVGLAADIDASDYALLDRLAAQVGMRRTISSEIWHYEIVSNPSIPASEFARFSAVVDKVFGRSTPHDEAEAARAAEAARQAAEAARLQRVRNNVSGLPLIAQQNVIESKQYGVNVAIWESGVTYWLTGAQRDAYRDAGAAFIECRNPGRFEFFIEDAAKRAAILRGQDVAAATEGARKAVQVFQTRADELKAPSLLSKIS
jgi:hypothetical protein